MKLYLWLGFCFLLLALLWSLTFFRRSLATFVARHSVIATTLAVLLAGMLFLLSFTPLFVWINHAMQ